MTSDWRAKANCRGMDPDLFFIALGNQYKKSRPLPEAIHACATCPPSVHAECYIYALRHEEHGYWASTTPADRRRLRTIAGIAVEQPGVPLVLNSRPHAQEIQHEVV